MISCIFSESPDISWYDLCLELCWFQFLTGYVSYQCFETVWVFWMIEMNFLTRKKTTSPNNFSQSPQNNKTKYIILPLLDLSNFFVLNFLKWKFFVIFSFLFIAQKLFYGKTSFIFIEINRGTYYFNNCIDVWVFSLFLRRHFQLFLFYREI